MAAHRGRARGAAARGAAREGARPGVQPPAATPRPALRLRFRRQAPAPRCRARDRGRDAALRLRPMALAPRGAAGVTAGGGRASPVPADAGVRRKTARRLPAPPDRPVLGSLCRKGKHPRASRASRHGARAAQKRRMAAPRTARRRRGGREPRRYRGARARPLVLSRHRQIRSRGRRAARGTPVLRLRPLQDSLAPPRQARRARRGARRLMHAELVIPGLFAGKRATRHSALELLLAKGRCRSARAQPLDAWLQQAFGLDALPAGALTLLGCGRNPGETSWARADPVHLRLMREHVIVVPGEALELSEEEAAKLCEALNAHFPGKNFAACDARRWCVQLSEAPSS